MSDDDVHVVPVNDLIDHDLEWDCVCGPIAEFVEATGAWIYVHHSLDGREQAA